MIVWITGTEIQSQKYTFNINPALYFEIKLLTYITLLFFDMAFFYYHQSTSKPKSFSEQEFVTFSGKMMMKMGGKGGSIGGGGMRLYFRNLSLMDIIWSQKI